MSLALNVLEQGFLFSLVSIGVYITYKILDFPDMSVDGSFPLGAAVCAALLSRGMDPILSVFIALAAGAVAGFFTGILHVKLKIDSLLSGILIMISLYSMNLRIMGKSNIPLFTFKNIFKEKELMIGDLNFAPIIIILIFVIVAKLAIDLFLKTKRGFLLIATGDNEQVVTSLGINSDNVKILALMISNALVALAGALTAQYQGFSDVGMGTGTVVMGLASVIIGVSVLKKVSFIKITTLAIFGAIVYKSVVAIALQVGLSPNDLKLVTALIVIIALTINNKGLIFKRKKSMKGGAVLNVSSQESI
ncbi:ABC transporter permease [Clostridium paridis]|uniref:ABC transporter permease n=1 Tax=Clostridium paridis TaxID=2803863 RepID=A0A937FIF6_9CLOT|nr:ABC transporter permease [Clostridium paridis]MBL4932031.1 ABC transporter permease [Clostridium paridis]